VDEGLADVLHDKMSQVPVPNRIVSEITITDPVTRHEGRIDAIFAGVVPPQLPPLAELQPGWSTANALGKPTSINEAINMLNTP
jgi:hypothetical protein